MTDYGGGAAPGAGETATDGAWPGQAAMANLPAPPLPDGFPARLAHKALVYLRPDKIPAVLPHVDPVRSGMILAGDGTAKALRILQAARVTFPVLTDPEGYKKHTATCEAPFRLPAEDGMFPVTLGAVLDAQLQAGAATALTPTGYIKAAETDVLKAAVSEFAGLGRKDAIFLAPLDISLLGRGYFDQTASILVGLQGPVALVLGCQGNPLDHSKDIIPNLRQLAARVPLIPVRTDFNGLDLLAHGAVAAAIGTGGSVRHAVDPAEKGQAFNPGPAPSVLWPQLLTFFKGSSIAELFGARPQQAPSCPCAPCHGRMLTRFLSRDQQGEAIAHGVANWSPLATRLLSAPTVRDRADLWKAWCEDAVATHQAVLDALRLLEGLKPQTSLNRWAALPAWPAGLPTRVA
jgi:hypothetical protein